MTRRDLLNVAAAAAATFVLAVAAFLPRNLDAGDGDPAARLSPKIASPQLVVSGCQLSISNGEGLNAGQKPTFDLLAFNPTDQSADVNVTVQLTVTLPVSPMSRSLPLPTMLWQESRIITLAPGQREIIPIHAGNPLPERGNIAVNLVWQKQAVTAMRFPLGESQFTVAAHIQR